MVAPAIAGAAISGGLSILGGLFGRSSAKKQQARQNAYNDPSAIRARFEKAGFHPLLGINNPSALQQEVNPTNYMGTAIANAGLAISDGLTQQAQLDIERDRLKLDKTRLSKLIEKQTIRPKIGGLYAATQATPTNKSGGINLRPPKRGELVPTSNPYPGDSNLDISDVPTTVMFDDGIPGANPESPREAEADIWDWALDGTLTKNLGKIWDRNFGERHHLGPKAIDRFKKDTAPLPKTLWQFDKEKRQEWRKTRRSEKYQPKKGKIVTGKPLRSNYGKPGSRTGF